MLPNFPDNDHNDACPREPGEMRRGSRSRGESGPGMNGKGGSNTPL
jgi:hypothetical protein